MVLMRQIGAGAGSLPVTIGEQGEVSVEDHALGRLEGFRFIVDPEARAADKRMLLAAAEKRLGAELRKRGAALVEAEESDLALASATEITWQGVVVAKLNPGPNLARPRIVLDRALDVLDAQVRTAIQNRLESWFADQVRRHLPALAKLDAATRDPAAGPRLRAIAGALLEAGGLLPRRAAGPMVEALDPEARKGLRSIGFTIGTLDLFAPGLLKPGAARWRRTLMGLGEGPREGATVLPRNAPGADLPHGFRPLGAQAVRVDLVERIARAAHDLRAKDSKGGRKPFAPDPALATSMGVQPETLARLMAQLGFSTARGRPGQWVWQGLVPTAKAKPAPTGNAFAALASIRDG
jgi:ATP-dependent RNA helicase SUPV3L1/SUV3